jgi:NADH-quinone oxidoreductase subunit G/NADP-reducing hydrogenase subunit HndD
VAACANDVWEGVSVVTNNADLMSIRKMIVELLLADHPQDCLTCVRNTKCELQTLAEQWGIRASPFSSQTVPRRKKEAAGEMLVRDMGKCVKCGRCVEVCQEIQAVRAIDTAHRSINYEIGVPYSQPLIDSLCVFCGQCAVVCPVGAIYEYDQSSQVFKALNNPTQHVVAELAPSMSKALGEALNLAPLSITQGKLVTALKQMGFDKVFDAAFFEDLSISEEIDELLYRIKNSGKLPMVSGCSPGWNKFAESGFPDIENHLAASRSSGLLFGASVKENCASLLKVDKASITSVSFMPCIAKKLETRILEDDFSRNVNFSLTPRELGQMIRHAGIIFDNLPESPFDTLVMPLHSGAQIDSSLILKNEEESQEGITETMLNIQGTDVKIMLVRGLANARNVLEYICNGECDADFIKIMSCPGGCTIRS